MRLNLETAHGEAWEKSSIVSGYTSTFGNQPHLAKVDIKASLSALPAPETKSEALRDE